MNELDTPMTDAEIDDARNVALEFECRNPPPKEGENCYVVPAEFARELERKLHYAKLDADCLRAKLMLITKENEQLRAEIENRVA